MRQKSDLRPAQDRVASRLFENDAILAVVPMGGGKTAAAMTAIRELLDDEHIRGAVVFAPKKVAQLVWSKEHLLWEHLRASRITLVAGTPKKRAELLRDSGTEIWVVGIDNMQWFLDEVASFPDDHPIFDLFCVDEMSRFKNPRGKRAKAFLRFCAKRKKVWPIRWGLTGTPRPNGYEDLFKPMGILTAETLWGRSFDKWRTERFMPLDYQGYNWAIRPDWRDRTRREAGMYSITISDEDMPYLDPITRVIHWVDLPASARAVYKTMERELIADLEDGTLLAANAAVAAGKLAQAANGFMYQEDGTAATLHSEKIDMLADLAEGVGDEPFLIGYEFKEDLRLLKHWKSDLPNMGSGTSDADTERLEDEWNRRKLPCMAIHPASAGHGLNLQHGGSQFIWYSMPWSAENYDQTLKRIHRPGQTKRVFEHMILARDTVDEAKLDRIVNKLSEQEAFRRYLEKA